MIDIMDEKEKREETKMAKIDLMKMDEDRTMGGTWSYLFYGDAKRAGIRRGDRFQVVTEIAGAAVELGEWIAEEYINYRNDKARPFSGFRCVRAAE